LKSKLTGSISADNIKQITSSVYSLPTLNLSRQQNEQVIEAYMTGMRTIFTIYAPIIGICCICGFLIKDDGVAEKDAKVARIDGDSENNIAMTSR
jgi:H+/gluconate symporter-like permease